MDKYEILAILVLSLFLLPIGYVVYVIVSIFRSPKLPPPPPLEDEPWPCKGKTLTITYRVGLRPAQKIIDGITGNLDKYEVMIASHLRAAAGNESDFRQGLRPEGVSFPVSEDDHYDFCINYVAEDGSDMVCEVYFKDGKIQEVAAGD